ncbi:MAG TPA: hypothetical protein VFN27_14155 [Xanthobacteraceae bacterium]|nr:hypothetical protein [Xanthobacteraceae bacterium]
MDLTIRDLTVDELERVVGGDAPVGAGTDDEMCTTPAMIFKVAHVKVLVVTHSCDSL